MITTGFSPQVLAHSKSWGMCKSLNIQNRLKFRGDSFLFETREARRLLTPSEKLKDFENFLKIHVYPDVDVDKPFKTNLSKLRFLIKYMDTSAPWTAENYNSVHSHKIVANIYSNEHIDNLRRDMINSFRELYKGRAYTEDNWGEILINTLYNDVAAFYSQHRNSN